jgi:hypothetical protein
MQPTGILSNGQRPPQAPHGPDLRRRALLGLVAGLALAAAGCGRKGDLYLPEPAPEGEEREP